MFIRDWSVSIGCVGCCYIEHVHRAWLGGPRFCLYTDTTKRNIPMQFSYSKEFSTLKYTRSYRVWIWKWSCLRFLRNYLQFGSALYSYMPPRNTIRVYWIVCVMFSQQFVGKIEKKHTLKTFCLNSLYWMIATDFLIIEFHCILYRLIRLNKRYSFVRREQ